jgi:hypothetical protein
MPGLTKRIDPAMLTPVVGSELLIAFSCHHREAFDEPAHHGRGNEGSHPAHTERAEEQE